MDVYPCGRSARHNTSNGADSEDDIRNISVYKLAACITQQTFVAIMEFYTATDLAYLGIDGTPTTNRGVVAKTGVMLTDDNGQSAFHIEGQFRLVQEIRPHAPELGVVKQDITVRQGRHGLDIVWQSLEGLIPCLSGLSQENFLKSAQSYLVLGPTGTSDISKLVFLGPITGQEINQVVHLAKLLINKSLNDWTEEEAKRLLSENDPWLRALGVIRLDPRKRPLNWN